MNASRYKEGVVKTIWNVRMNVFKKNTLKSTVGKWTHSKIWYKKKLVKAAQLRENNFSNYQKIEKIVLQL